MKTSGAEAYVVVTEVGERRTFLCEGYRGEPAVTPSFGIADKFGSRRDAEALKALYVERHRNVSYALAGWRVAKAAAFRSH
jgi:hypothetical protein